MQNFTKPAIIRQWARVRQWPHALSRAAWLFTALIVISAADIQPAPAQLNIQIGGNEAQFKARLSRAGYDRIETVKIGLSNSIFRACKGGKQFSIKFEWTGSVEEKVIGDCRAPLDEEGLRALLERRGYDRIRIEAIAGGFEVSACLGGNRYQLVTDAFGEERSSRRAGSCQRFLSPEDVTALLESRGYEEIEIVDVSRREYRVLACLDRTRYRMTVDNTGRILDRTRTGGCRSRLSPEEIIASLESEGLSEIAIMETYRHSYVVEACRREAKVRLVVGSGGGIRDEDRIGDCRREVDRTQIVASMRENGFTNVSVNRQGGEFIARGCRSNRYMEVRLNQWGELLDRRELGSCSAPRINELAEQLRARGLDRLEFHVEACEGGRRVRITFDEFANRIDRRVIGQVNGRDICQER